MTDLRPASCIIYDLDGVLLDTEPLYTRATQEIVSQYGKDFGWEQKRHMIGRPAIESARFLVEALELPISAEEYLARREQRLRQLFREARPVAGARRFTDEVARLGGRQAVATSSESRLLECKISAHEQWFALFDAIVAGDDPRLARGKPAPDIFLLAAEDAGVPPSKCLVIEDSPAGVAAARAAGMQVIALPDAAMDPGLFSEADLVAEGFAALDATRIVARAD
ncbi:MAG: HAD family hydrolase [Deltaproteobacteria bacterium]|nr:MAG: HAD family hydrolase [Deltaproteobacteria bacterium]